MDDGKYTPWQLKELEKCAGDFLYFCERYVKIIHPMKGLVPFKLYEFQKRVVSDYEQHQFNIVSKFRQAGLTTVTVIWSLWRCLFKTDQRIMVLSKSDREAIGVGKIVQNVKDNLPSWMMPIMGNDNDHEKEFKDTGSVIWFFTVQGTRSRALTYLIIDEAAFIPNMHEHWKGMYPTLATGGRCIAISTVNGIGNWYEETYTRAKDKKNQFHIIELDYTEHPEYNNPEWVRRMRGNLTEKGWLQEIMRSFLGSGETYIDSNIISSMEKKLKDPIRKLFPDWDGTKQDNWGEEELPNEFYEKGAMWVWKEPEENHEYIIGVDAAEGVGEEGDNSAFHVFDVRTMEQVAEFYSNIIPIHKFSQVLEQVAHFYNTGMVVVEHDTGPGLAVLNRLEHTLYYENLYYSPRSSGRDKIGVTLNKTLRPVFLETMQTCFSANLVTINSIRLIRELKTFIYNRQKQKACAQNGKHDDLVMSCCIALHVTDILNREMPPNAKDEMQQSLISKTFAGASTEMIRLALEEGLPDDFFGEDETLTHEELLPKVMVGNKRPLDKLLRGFGWGVIPFIPTLYIFLERLRHFGW